MATLKSTLLVCTVVEGNEEYLGKINWKEKGLKLVFTPLSIGAQEMEVITHTPQGLRKHLLPSLEGLNADSLEMWYLHGPDRSVPYEATFKAVNDLHKEGYFKRFGISNYAAWEVAELLGYVRRMAIFSPRLIKAFIMPYTALSSLNFSPAFESSA